MRAQDTYEDSIVIQLGKNIKKPLYQGKQKRHGAFYNWAWGKHYSHLYYEPVTTKAVSLNSLFGGLDIVQQIPSLHAIILTNKYKQPYLLKPLGGSSSFLESKFFTDIYKKEDFKDTYLNDFIMEAYTIIHPYMITVSDRLAKSINISSTNPEILFVTGGIESDTIADGSLVKNKLASIAKLPSTKSKDVLHGIDTLLLNIQNDKKYKVDQKLYIRTRLFDMLIGDWNKVSENWYWLPSSKGDSTIYIPHVYDRSHAFSKVDGTLFKELLNMLGLGFITNYDKELNKVEKFNKLAYAQDIAITQNSKESNWLEQARFIKSTITDKTIDKAFASLPIEMQNESTEKLKENLKQRRDNLEYTASKYYLHIQKTPVVTGTNSNDSILIEQGKDKTLRIRIYDRDNNILVLDKEYRGKYTKEIWVYPLDGNDILSVSKSKRNIPLLLIGGKGDNNYQIKSGNNVSIYETSLRKEELTRKYKHSKTKVIVPNDEEAMNYDYRQLRYTKLALTPIGIYDSDLGLNLGTSLSYTIYGFRRAPYSRRHQISYDYSHGFTYQGIFPSYDEKKSLHVVAFIGSPAYFSNFFGFGNDTKGYKGEKKNYNRVNISKYMISPSLYYNISKVQTVNVFGSFELYKVKNPKDRDRYINKVYEDGNSIFSPRYYLNTGAEYEINKKFKGALSSFKFSLSAGWNINITDPVKNYAYSTASLGLNIKLTDRITLATLIKGKALSSNKYEFFQAATTELRGYRDNRFIGKQSLYQYSDIRFDLGRLQNPFTPLNYGVFAGIDHGRVWYPLEDSGKWHSSYGGGFWLTLLRKFTGKFSYFGSEDGSRFSFELGMGF